MRRLSEAQLRTLLGLMPPAVPQEISSSRIANSTRSSPLKAQPFRFSFLTYLRALISYPHIAHFNRTSKIPHLNSPRCIARKNSFRISACITIVKLYNNFQPEFLPASPSRYAEAFGQLVTQILLLKLEVVFWYRVGVTLYVG